MNNVLDRILSWTPCVGMNMKDNWPCAVWIMPNAKMPLGVLMPRCSCKMLSGNYGRPSKKGFVLNSLLVTIVTHFAKVAWIPMLRYLVNNRCGPNNASVTLNCIFFIRLRFSSCLATRNLLLFAN